MTTRMAQQHEEGTAILVVLVLGTVLLIPLVYVVLSVMAVQSASYAVTSAARESARAYVTGGSVAEANRRARTAARIVLGDANINLDGEPTTIRCLRGPCLTTGSTVEVTVSVPVTLLFVDGGPTITVRSVQLAPIDPYRDPS